MTDKEKLYQILSSLWKNDDSVGKTYYNQALIDVQTAIDSMQGWPISEDLEKAMQNNAPNNIGIDDYLYWRNGFINGAKWQKAKNQETIELAEDHAMLAG